MSSVSFSPSRASNEDSDSVRQLLDSLRRPVGPADMLKSFRRLSDRITAPDYRRGMGIRG